MKPETTGLDLLAAAEQTLAREVAPSLSGEARYKTLMAASAIRMVMREMAHADELQAAASKLGNDGALVAAIRQGDHDDDRGLHKALLDDARVRTCLSNPAFGCKD